MQNNSITLQLLAYGIDRGRQTVAAIRVKARGTARKKGGPIGGLRKKVTRYTSASLARFREAILAVEPALEPRRRGNRRHYPASFLTLTYPERWDRDPCQWKRHLDRWFQRLKRRYPRAWAIWALEFQAREAPHFHLIICWHGTRPKETWQERRQWISSSWAAVVGGGAPQMSHRGAGTQARPLRNVTAARNYINKRQSKDAVPEGFGRWWGIHNRKAYKIAEVLVEVLLSPKLTEEVLARILESWRRYWGLDDDAEPRKIPRWVAGRAANDVLQAAEAWAALFEAVWVDPQTGEVMADNDNENVLSPIDMLPGSSDAAPPPPTPAAAPNPSPRPQGKAESVHCEDCGRLQNYLVGGLCWHCQWYPKDPQSPQARAAPPIPRWLTRANSSSPLDCCLMPHPCAPQADGDPGPNGAGEGAFYRA